jgi:hypothetical protein
VSEPIHFKVRVFAIKVILKVPSDFPKMISSIERTPLKDFSAETIGRAKHILKDHGIPL